MNRDRNSVTIHLCFFYVEKRNERNSTPVPFIEFTLVETQLKQRTMSSEVGGFLQLWYYFDVVAL